MTLESRIETLIKSLYVGEVVNDPWVILLRNRLRDFAEECYEEAAVIAKESPSRPGAVIEVSEVRLTPPFITDQEMGDHIAKRIRKLKDK